MKQVTRWSPDTCSCILEYEWDDTLEDSARTHSFKKVVQLCDHHKALVAAQAYNAVLSENTRKNQAWGLAKAVKPDLEIDSYTWSFEGTGENRRLKAGFLGKLSAAERANLQAQCNSKFGAGKVEVI